jgi:hypothetical protein
MPDDENTGYIAVTLIFSFLATWKDQKAPVTFNEMVGLHSWIFIRLKRNSPKDHYRVAMPFINEWQVSLIFDR